MIFGATAFEVVRLIDLQAPGETGYCMLVDVPPDEHLLSDLREELAVQTAGSLGIVDAKGRAVTNLIDELQAGQYAAVLVYGFEEWDEKQFTALDVNRSRLDVGCFLVFNVDLETAGRFLDNAPNIRSYLGANIFAAQPDPSAMGPQEVADRLDQLRHFYMLTDEEVLKQAQDGTLPSEPHFIEWLVLLGRGELVP